MNYKQTYVFNKISSTETSTSKHEHCFICNEDDPWPVVVQQFATFLDECGYVGVAEAIDIMFEERDEFRAYTAEDQMNIFDGGGVGQ
jgi:hypothetical protein